jgi:hypothetical protein
MRTNADETVLFLAVALLETCTQGYALCIPAGLTYPCGGIASR